MFLIALLNTENPLIWRSYRVCGFNIVFGPFVPLLKVVVICPWIISNKQVINAALTLAARPQSKVAQDNMDVFKDQWEKQVRVLTEAVDDITSVDDFLSVSGNHKQAPYKAAGEENMARYGISCKCHGSLFQVLFLAL